MKHKCIKIAMLLLAVLLLSGCNIRTVDKLYLLPERSDAYKNLQSLINQALNGREYSAPISGENRQSVQMVDLDGDGVDEFLLFAKGSAEKPLQIFIYTETEDEEYMLAGTIESTGTTFEQVEYVQMDGEGGYEIVVGCQVSDSMLRAVSVHTMKQGQMEQVLTANYSKFVCSDLDGNGFSELLVLRPGRSEADNGVAELYAVTNGTVERSAEVSMSEPSSDIKRIMVGKLDDGLPAVYVASDVDGSAIITDVYAIVDGAFTNVSFSNESGTSVQTLRNYYVYADDMDEDGVVELPSIITMKPVSLWREEDQKFLLRWFSMDEDGWEIDKLFTYHNYVGGWYLRLGSGWANRVSVDPGEGRYVFYVWNESYDVATELFTVYVFTGASRDEDAVKDGRFALYRTEGIAYSAKMSEEARDYGVTEEYLIECFRLIRQDWQTGET